MSHHLDSMEVRNDSRLDISDGYVFKGDDGTAFVMNVNPQSGEGGFHPEASYEINIDTTGDYKPNLQYRATFGPLEEGEAQQNFSLEKVVYDKTGRPHSQEIASGETGQIIETEAGKFFAGPAAEPFYIAGPVVGAAKEAIAHGEPIDLSGFNPNNSENLFGNTNVQSIVLEIPDEILAVKSIGAWFTEHLPTDRGGKRQIQHVGKPLVNTLFDFTDHHADYNATPPHRGERLFGRTVEERTARVVRAMGSALNPERHADRVVTDIFPDILEYTIGTEASFADRNGRNLTDPDAENMISFILNQRIRMGLDATDASGTLRDTFPYVSRPI